MRKWPKPSLLPPQLEILSLYTRWGLTAENIAELPRSLRNIDAHLVINSDTEWALLPPALEKAKFNDVVLSATNVPYLRSLPLKQLDAVTMTLEDSLNAPWISQLPSTLTHLNFLKSAFPISAMVIKSLPRGINTLELKRIVGEDIEEGQNLFPPNLTSLKLSELPQTREICDILMKCLPQTLKSFSTDDAGKDLKPLELLPPNVTYCSISSRSAYHETIVTLPEGLRNFTTSAVRRGGGMPIFVFPCCLTRLSLHGLRSLELVKSFPQTLTDLHIDQPVEVKILDLLPLGLRKLSLEINTDINGAQFKRYTALESCKIGSEDVNTFRGTFPASLRVLELWKIVERTKIWELPSSLEDLLVEIDGELTNQVIRQLPRSLRGLVLRTHGWSKVTANAMQWLPPHLAPRDVYIKNIFNGFDKFPFLASQYY